MRHTASAVRSSLILALLTCAGLAACSKPDQGQVPSSSPSSASAPAASASNPPQTQREPPLPAPNAPANVEPSPKPGQAGDHSSPAFKEGGKTEPKS